MLSRRSFVLGGTAAGLLSRKVAAQCAPVDLGIPNISQETMVWCWVAVAQQIIFWKTGSAPSQCALVAMANAVHPANCCGGNPQCHVTGQLQQIQYLIAQFGGSMSTISPPAGPGPVYNTLLARQAIIMAVQSSPYMGHVVVIRGMSCYGSNPILHINDPMGWPMLSQPTPFQQIMPYWSAAIVVA